tara:strand:+ start:1989 stop:2252 length:264 start_codon:yes stop_codon:yes gene_type:complete
MDKKIKTVNKIKMDLLCIESERLHRTIEDMYMRDLVPELCEVIVQLSLKDIILSRGYKDERVNIDDFIDATKLGIAYIEMVSNQTKH